MPLFEISDQQLIAVEQSNFPSEKVLQELIEANLEIVFNSRLVASEFSTGSQHGGRIDTLALSEDNNPIIIEYKKVESSELITQSLFYLHWLKDHRGDFEMAVQKALGNDTPVDWSDIRVICIAPDYRKYDLHAVQVMGANLELWKYRLYENFTLHLEEVLQPTAVASSKKGTEERGFENYTLEDHLKGKPDNIRSLALTLHDKILALDSAIEAAPKKLYIAYRISQNIVCLEIQQKQVLIFIKLDPKRLRPLPENARDVTNIGHYGTGDLEIRVRTVDDVEQAMPYIEMAYKKVGG